MSDKKEYKVGEIFRLCGETFQQLGNRIDVVTKPKEGMLFRSYDGVLYELKRLCNDKCCCDIHCSTGCADLDEEAFGKMISPDLHWYPVEEPKEEETMEKKRHLELAVVKVEGDQVTFRIAEQTHREIDFSKNAPYHHFCGSNGIDLFSFDHPCYDPERDDIYMRGRCYSCDDEQMTVSVDKFAKIMETINEYNETDGKGYKKPWPQDGDTYLWVGSTGFIHESDYDNDAQRDSDRREFGNFFRTREEAEAALERVKKALKGE